MNKTDIHAAYEKLYEVSKKHEKLYKLATKKLSNVELDWEELSTKFNKANQTIGTLWFENNFLAEKTKKLEAELFQVKAQLERTSSQEIVLNWGMISLFLIFLLLVLLCLFHLLIMLNLRIMMWKLF